MYNALLMAQEDNPDYDFSGKHTYIENSANTFKNQNQWQHDFAFYADTFLDVICVDGGVEAFLNTDDSEAILVLDKALWEEFAPVLTGYVIMEDNSYFVFNKHRYGE